MPRLSMEKKPSAALVWTAEPSKLCAARSAPSTRPNPDNSSCSLCGPLIQTNCLVPQSVHHHSARLSTIHWSCFSAPPPKISGLWSEITKVPDDLPVEQNIFHPGTIFASGRAARCRVRIQFDVEWDDKADSL